jgi:hypothetical protein
MYWGGRSAETAWGLHTVLILRRTPQAVASSGPCERVNPWLTGRRILEVAL